MPEKENISENNDTHICSRFEQINVDFSTFKVTETAEGYLKGDAILTRTGVFKYMNKDGGVFGELRTEDEVFSQKSMESFKLIPITDNHPQELVNSQNAKQLQIGFVGENIRRDGNNLIGNLVITDGDIIHRIKTGLKRELSLGYKTILVEEKGNKDGADYIYKQTNIAGNHLAVVDRARAGHEARLNLDGNDAICMSEDNFINIIEAQSMKKVNIDSKDFEVAEEVAQKIDAVESEKASLTTKNQELQSKLDSVEGERDAFKAEIEEMKKVDSEQIIADRVKARISLEKKAGEFVKEDMSELSEKDIMLKVINKFSPEFKADEKSDEYVKARFDAALDFKKAYNLAEQIKATANVKDSAEEKAGLSDKELANKLINKSREVK